MLTTFMLEQLHRAYDVPGGIFSNDEFEEDVMRIMFVVRLLNKWHRGKQTNFRLLINHVVILRNMFSSLYKDAIREQIEDPELDELFNSVLMFMGQYESSTGYNREFLECLRNELM